MVSRSGVAKAASLFLQRLRFQQANSIVSLLDLTKAQLQLDITETQQDVYTIQSDLASAKQDLQSATSKLSEVETQTLSLNTGLNNHGFQTMESLITQLDSAFDQIDTQINTNINQISSAQAAISTTQTAVGLVDQRVTTLQSDTQTSVDSLQQQLDSFSNVQSDIASLQVYTDSLQQQVDQVDTSNYYTKSAVDALVAQLVDQINVLTSQISDIQTTHYTKTEADSLVSGSLQNALHVNDRYMRTVQSLKILTTTASDITVTGGTLQIINFSNWISDPANNIKYIDSTDCSLVYTNFLTSHGINAQSPAYNMSFGTTAVTNIMASSVFFNKFVVPSSLLSSKLRVQYSGVANFMWKGSFATGVYLSICAIQYDTTDPNDANYITTSNVASNRAVYPCLVTNIVGGQAQFASKFELPPIQITHGWRFAVTLNHNVNGLPVVITITQGSFMEISAKIIAV